MYFLRGLPERLKSALQKRAQMDHLPGIKQVLPHHGERPVALRQLDHLDVSVLARLSKEDEAIWITAG